jgi:peptidoglycan/xylan/chitin deacetylase (PgdA/CDA1 family)
MGSSRLQVMLIVVALGGAAGVIWLAVARQWGPEAAETGTRPEAGARQQAVATTPALPPALTPGRSVRLTVLMYHHVGPAPVGAQGWVRDLYVPTERFAHDLGRLREHGCCVMTMTQALWLIAEDRLPARAVVLTFDDGYLDNYMLAAPLLRQYGMGGTFNVVVSKIGDDKHMTRRQLRELADAGDEIGCHSLTHPDLRKVDDARLRREVAGAKGDLETLLGRPVLTYCYPDGKYDARTVRVVATAGYRVALATGLPAGRFVTGHPFEVGRYRVTPRKQIPTALLQDRSEETGHE